MIDMETHKEYIGTDDSVIGLNNSIRITNPSLLNAMKLIQRDAVENQLQTMQLPLLRLLYQACGSDWVKVVDVIKEVVSKADSEDANVVKQYLSR